MFDDFTMDNIGDDGSISSELAEEVMVRFVQGVKRNCRLLEERYGFCVVDVSTDGEHIVYHTDWVLSEGEFEELRGVFRSRFVGGFVCDVGLRLNDDGESCLVLFELIGGVFSW